MNCVNCLSEIPEGRSACPVCGTVRNDVPTPTIPAGDAATLDETPLDRGRFIAGTVLAGRYRIVGLLGRGGMGEIYKAEDLRLHHLVALKFLPEALSSDSAMIARFHREVRIARQITHPNVCRVHDIEQIPFASTTLHFISMEFIDGEDLAASLRRVQHLTVEKAMELARQICAGLSAAHEMGVVHRDLKPANVMLDGRGRARITDFGLSGVAEEFRHDGNVGTPAYMAPEQLSGAPATTQSDLYALGLVLYEIFTGKRPFQGRSVAELTDQHRNATPTPPSSHIKEIDPAAERAILRCLAREPGDRPAGALEILSAFSGGDPLGEAVAAGMTPSPEMVAAAGQKVGFRPLVAWSCLVVIVLTILVVMVPLNPAAARNQRLGLSPEVLVDKARGILSDLGYSELPESTYDFAVDENYVPDLKESRPSWGMFRFQESPLTVESVTDARGIVYAAFGKPRVEQHNVMRPTRSVVLGLQGSLMEFYAFQSFTAGDDRTTPDWSVLFTAAGIDPTSLTPAAAKSSPPVVFDTQVAWQGNWPGHSDIPMSVEAASWHGKPVYFQIQGPASSAVPPDKESARVRAFAAFNVGVVLFILVIATAIPLARRNMQAGRDDRRGAFRIGLFVFVVLLLSWVFGSDHRLDPLELNLFVAALGDILFRSIVVSLVYLAVEPLVRQRWPHALIPWNRVLEGRFRDPVVGRAALVGIVFAAAYALLKDGLLLSKVMSPDLPEPGLLTAILSNSFSISFLLALVSDSVSLPLALFALFSIFRIVLRSRWLAGVAFVLLINAYTNPQHEIAGIIVATVYSLLWLIGVMRFGLIAGMSMWFADGVFRAWSMLAPATWYVGRLYFLMAAVLVLSVYAFVTSLGTQPIVSLELFAGPRNSARA